MKYMYRTCNKVLLSDCVVEANVHIAGPISSVVSACGQLAKYNPHNQKITEKEKL